MNIDDIEEIIEEEGEELRSLSKTNSIPQEASAVVQTINSNNLADRRLILYRFLSCDRIQIYIVCLFVGLLVTIGCIVAGGIVTSRLTSHCSNLEEIYTNATCGNVGDD